MKTNHTNTPWGLTSLLALSLLAPAGCGDPGDLPGLEAYGDGTGILAPEMAPDGGAAQMPPPEQEPEGFEPDERAVDLEDQVGSEAVSTFLRHQQSRAQGNDPDRLAGDQPEPRGDGVGVRKSALVTSRTIYGYVRDSFGRPVSGVRVTAFDSDPDDDDQMGRVFTDSRGYYEIHYRGGHWDPCPHQWTCWRPDIYVTVSARRWKIVGPRYDGKPLCNDVEYGWQRVATSRQYGNWKLKNPLRVDLVTPPRSQIWDERGDKPSCLQGPFCYYFRYIKTQCWGVVETLTGCAGNQEYTWKAPCFGWFSATLPGREKCFSKPLNNTPALSPATPSSNTFRNISTPVTTNSRVSVIPTRSTLSPTFTFPRSIRPVATVPRPVIEKTSSTGIKNGRSTSRTGSGMCSSTASINSHIALHFSHSRFPQPLSDASFALPFTTGMLSPSNS